MSIETEIEEAIGAHARWMVELSRAVLEARPDIDAADLRATDCCELGRWLYGPSFSSADREAETYREVDRLHGEFHEMAARVVELAAEGRSAEAYALLYGDYVTLSGRLAMALRVWQSRLLGDQL